MLNIDKQQRSIAATEHIFYIFYIQQFALFSLKELELLTDSTGTSG